MQKEFPAVFVCIADLQCFLQNVYTEMEGIGKLSPWIENIFAKGRLLNVFIFGAYNVSQNVTMMDKIAYLNFNSEKNGIVLGGELSKQNVLSYTNISYSEQIKRLKPGIAYATNAEDNQLMDMIVIPQNKGLTQS